ncbi:hypothetical protein BST61_g2385 [Cercospora zeina]
MPSAVPLRWEKSADACHPTVADHLPNEVVTCLTNARFLHLATCTNNVPHVSLMKYTYLPSHPFPQSTATQLPTGPTIIMTSNPSSKKTLNLLQNPNVSILVHDWVSSRPPNSLSGSDRERSPAGGARSSLAAMLMQMNSTAVSSFSITMNGEAVVLEPGSEEEKWCKEQHVANNTFEDADSSRVGRGSVGGAGDSGKEAYIDEEDVRVVVVKIKGGRISDWQGNVSDWALRGSGESVQSAVGVNGT